MHVQNFYILYRNIKKDANIKKIKLFVKSVHIISENICMYIYKYIFIYTIKL